MRRWKAKRDSEIQRKFDHMTDRDGMRSSVAILRLASEYDRAPTTIRDIVYSPPPAQADQKVEIRED